MSIYEDTCQRDKIKEDCSKRKQTIVRYGNEVECQVSNDKLSCSCGPCVPRRAKRDNFNNVGYNQFAGNRKWYI